MLVLLDQSTPVGIRTFLQEHRVQTCAQRGWDTLKNGDLLEAAEKAGFQVFLTPDKNVRHQQNLAIRTIAIVVVGTPQWPLLRQYVERVVEAVNAALPGSYVEVAIPNQ
jgi:hypothetical protein